MKRRRVLAATGGVLGVVSVPGMGVGPERATASTVYGGSEFAYGFTGFSVDSDATVKLDSEAPASIDFEIRGEQVSREESVEFDLTVTNESNETIYVGTGRPWPFGLLWFSDPEGDRGFLAWSDDYGLTKEERIERCEKHLLYPDDYRLIEVGPGETLSEGYSLSTRTHTIESGSFQGLLDFEITTEDQEESWYPDVEVDVELEPLRDPHDPEFGRGFSASAINDDEFDGRLSVDVVEQPTDAYPAVIDVTFESGWEERRTVEAEDGFPFGEHALDGDTGQRLVLLPAQLYAPGFVRSPSCWQSTVVPCRDGNQFSPGSETFDPGETVSERFVVLGHPADACPDAGTYSATAPYSSEGEGLTEKDQDGELGVSIELATRSDAYRESLERRGATPTTPTATQSDPGNETTPTQSPTPTPTRTQTTVTENATDTSDSTEGGEPTPTDGAGFGAVAGLLSIGGVLTYWFRKARGD